MLHFYIVPKVGGITTPAFPRYFEPGDGRSGSWISYGVADFLVASDVSDADHATLSGFSDVIAIPPLGDLVATNPTLNFIRNELRARSMPGNWVTVNHSFRQVVGTVGRCAFVLQRMFGASGRKLFGSGNVLDDLLTPELVTDFVATGQSFTNPPVNTSGITTSITIEQAILLIANQRPVFALAGETF